MSVTGTGDVVGPAGSNGVYNAGAGGTALTLPTSAPNALAFLGAMSAFGAAGAGAVSAPVQMRRLDHPMLAAGGHTALA